MPKLGSAYYSQYSNAEMPINVTNKYNRSIVHGQASNSPTSNAEHVYNDMSSSYYRKEYDSTYSILNKTQMALNQSVLSNVEDSPDGKRIQPIFKDSESSKDSKSKKSDT